MKKVLISFMAVALLLLVMVSGAYAWGLHTAVSNALGAGSSQYTADVPDTWGQSHFGSSYLAGKAQYYAGIAKGKAWYDPNKAVYSGYALHYMEDAGQPWHVYNGGVGGSVHIAFETYCCAEYPVLLASAKAGSLFPVYIGSSSDVYNKTVSLANDVDHHYPYLDTAWKWPVYFYKIAQSLYSTGSYNKGMLNYIWR